MLSPMLTNNLDEVEIIFSYNIKHLKKFRQIFNSDTTNKLEYLLEKSMWCTHLERLSASCLFTNKPQTSNQIEEYHRPIRIWYYLLTPPGELLQKHSKIFQNFWRKGLSTYYYLSFYLSVGLPTSLKLSVLNLFGNYASD